MKKIEDYLHLYLGCEMYYSTHHEPQNAVYILTARNLAEAIKFGDMPLLRPLESMTEEEAIELASLSEYEPHFRDVKTERNSFSNDIIVSWQGSNESREQFNATGDLFYCADQFQWLLKKGFDLFELIYYGLAIDSTKIETPK